MEPERHAADRQEDDQENPSNTTAEFNDEEMINNSKNTVAAVVNQEIGNNSNNTISSISNQYEFNMESVWNRDGSQYGIKMEANMEPIWNSYDINM